MVHLNKAVREFDSTPEFSPFTGVEYVIDDGETYFAGDRTGRVLTVNSILKTGRWLLPLVWQWENEKIAQNILEELTKNGQGFVYRPFAANDAILDPAAQLGDSVKVNGIISQLCTIDAHFDALGTADISAPQSDEVDHEYPFSPPAERETKREIVTLLSAVNGLRSILDTVDSVELSPHEVNVGSSSWLDPGAITYRGHELSLDTITDGDGNLVNIVTWD